MWLHVLKKILSRAPSIIKFYAVKGKLKYRVFTCLLVTQPVFK